MTASIQNAGVANQPSLPQDVAPVPPPPPPPPPSPPPSEEAEQTDQAVQSLQSAEQSLSSMQQLAAQGQNFAQAELSEGHLQQNVANARSGAGDAIDAEIDAMMAVDPTMTASRALGTILARYGADPALQAELRRIGETAQVDAAADDVLSALPSSNDPVADLHALERALAGAPQEVRDAVLADPRTVDLLDRAALAATDPIQPYLQPGDQRSGELTEDIRLALAGLEQASAFLGPDLAGALVDRGLRHFERLQDTELGGADIINGPANVGDYRGNAWVQLARLASHVHDAPGGQAMIDRLIDLNSDGEGWEHALEGIDTGAGQDPVLANPVGPAVFVALERRGLPLTANGESAAVYAMGPILAAIDGPIQGNAEDYYTLVETLQFAEQMRPLYGSQEEYDAALHILMTEKLGDDWQTRIQAQEQVLANDGSLLLSQLSQYMSLPTDSPMRAEVDRFIQDVLSDPAAQAAISLALRNDPSLAQGVRGDLLLDVFSTPGLDGGAQGLAAEFGNLYISSAVGAAIASVNVNDTSSIAAAQAQLDALGDPRLASALGVPPGSLTSAVAALGQSLPGLASTDPAQIEAAATSLNASLTGIPGFTSNDSAGQIFRGIAATAAGSGQVNALGVELDDPRVESALEIVMDHADFLKGGNFTAKMLISLAVNEGLIPASSAVGRYSALATGLGGRLFAAAGIAGDLWNAYKSFDGGDAASGTLHLAAAGGTLAGLLGAGTWVGPVGWAVAAIAYIGLGFVANAEHNNRFETEEMRNFLAASGLSDDAAAELFNTTGNAVSPVPFLLHYAEGHGLDTEQAIAWLNQLAADGQLGGVVELAHRTIDANDNDATGLPATHASDAQVTQEFENAGNPVGYAITLEPASLAQVDLVLEFFDIPLPG